MGPKLIALLVAGLLSPTFPATPAKRKKEPKAAPDALGEIRAKIEHIVTLALPRPDYDKAVQDPVYQVSPHAWRLPYLARRLPDWQREELAVALVHQAAALKSPSELMEIGKAISALGRPKEAAQIGLVLALNSSISDEETLLWSAHALDAAGMSASGPALKVVALRKAAAGAAAAAKRKAAQRPPAPEPAPGVSTDTPKSNSWLDRLQRLYSDR